MMESMRSLQLDLRTHNVKLVAALFKILAVLAHALPDRVTVWLGNRILRLYWYEYRVEHGPWQRADHRLTMEYSA